ncbi:MAG: mechanosensitive ion channel, partial [Myxococcota bacterium]
MNAFGEETADQIMAASVHLLPLLGALAALIVGWLLARFIAWLVFKALCRTTVDDWLVEKMGIEDWLKKRAKKHGASENLVEPSIQRIVYWALLVGVFIAVFEILDIKMISDPLSAMLKEVTTSVDDFLKAGLTLSIALVGAFMARFFIKTGLKKLKFDERSKKSAPEDAKTSITDTVGNIAFYGILFFALAPFLEALNLPALSAPVTNVIDKIMSVLPKAADALVVFGIGYVVSKIVKEIVTNLLMSIGLDKFVANLGFDKRVKDQSPSRLIGIIVQVIILVQLAISGFENLELTALSLPLTNMLNMLWTYVPKLLDVIILLAVGQIFDTLEMTVVATMIHDFLHKYVLKGVIAFVIVAAGFILGSIVQKIIAAHSFEGARLYFLLGTLVRYVILVFAITMAASHIGLGDQIVLYTFLLTFGAICLAFGLAFGLGGRDVVAQISREQFAKAKGGGFGDVLKSIGSSMETSGKKSTEEPPPSVDPAKEPAKTEASEAKPVKEEAPSKGDKKDPRVLPDPCPPRAFCSPPRGSPQLGLGSSLTRGLGRGQHGQNRHRRDRRRYRAGTIHQARRQGYLSALRLRSRHHRDHHGQRHARVRHRR